jgi:regulator of cell morphogenesis and NO signaling
MLKEKKYTEKTIGEIVAADFRTAEIFKNVGIDFCCGGNKNIEDACKEKSINKTVLISQINKLDETPISQAFDFNNWDLSFLVDYIKNTHHNYVLKSLPELVTYTQKIAGVHGSNHLELIEVADLFLQINNELLQHLKKEEDILFPAIKEAVLNNSDYGKSLIKSEIERMRGEHELAGGAMDTINTLTRNYELPIDACNTYTVTFKLLKQFEDDLHVHVHLENNILYPKALLLN